MRANLMLAHLPTDIYRLRVTLNSKLFDSNIAQSINQRFIRKFSLDFWYDYTAMMGYIKPLPVFQILVWNVGDFAVK